LVKELDCTLRPGIGLSAPAENVSRTKTKR
jgi:hypothetical protein